jgi:hypothetical protein
VCWDSGGKYTMTEAYSGINTAGTFTYPAVLLPSCTLISLLPADPVPPLSLIVIVLLVFSG